MHSFNRTLGLFPYGCRGPSGADKGSGGLPYSITLYKEDEALDTVLVVYS